MAHSTSVPYTHSTSVRRCAGSTFHRSSLLKAVVAFVATLLAAALASAAAPSTMAASATDAAAATPALSAAPTVVPPPAWLLRDSAATMAPQERLPLVRGSGAAAPRATAARDVGGSTAPGHEPRSTIEQDSRATAGTEPASTTESAPVETPATTATTAVTLASRLWQQLEALPLFVLLAGVAIAALLLRAIMARSQHGAARPDGVIEVLARYPVGRRQQIVLMRVGRRVIVAHQADRAMRTLSETGDPDEVAELIAKAQAPGRDLFARLLERRRAKVDPFAGAELVDLTREPAPFGAPAR